MADNTSIYRGLKLSTIYDNKISECYQAALDQLQMAQQYIKVIRAMDMETYRFDAHEETYMLENTLRSGSVDSAGWEDEGGGLPPVNQLVDLHKKGEITDEVYEEVIQDIREKISSYGEDNTLETFDRLLSEAKED